MWASAQWLFSIGCGLAHSGCHGNPSTQAIMYSTSSLAPPSTLHWWKELSIWFLLFCLRKASFSIVVLGWVNYHWFRKLVPLRNPNLPQILGESCQMLVARYGARSCL